MVEIQITVLSYILCRILFFVNVQDLRLPYVVSIDFWQYKVEVEDIFSFLINSFTYFLENESSMFLLIIIVVILCSYMVNLKVVCLSVH